MKSGFRFLNDILNPDSFVCIFAGELSKTKYYSSKTKYFIIPYKIHMVDKKYDIANFKTFMPGSNPNRIFLYDCSAEEISKIISELENVKSSDIPVKII